MLLVLDIVDQPTYVTLLCKPKEKVPHVTLTSLVDDVYNQSTNTKEMHSLYSILFNLNFHQNKFITSDFQLKTKFSIKIQRILVSTNHR